MSLRNSFNKKTFSLSVKNKEPNFYYGKILFYSNLNFIKPLEKTKAVSFFFNILS